MRPELFAKGNTRTVEKLKTLRQEAQADKAPRVVLRIQGILLSLDKHSTGEIAQLLHVDRTTVRSWILAWNLYREDGLLEGHRSGRPACLTEEQKEHLADIVDSGPVAYGLQSGVWTSPIIRQVIEEQFAVHYHPGHVRKILKAIGFSVQRPTTRLVQADPKQQNKWIRYTYPNLKKKAEQEQALIVYTDEVLFRQCPTLHQTWAALNSQPQIPTRGQRNTQKVLGAITLYDGHFVYRHQSDYFNASTYIEYLEQTLMPAFYQRGHRVYLIQDNASYHKKPEVYDWFQENRKRIEVFLLPTYSPELNAIERLWHYVRLNATHNRYFDTPEELCENLFRTFADIQNHPEKILGYLTPFF